MDIYHLTSVLAAEGTMFSGRCGVVRAMHAPPPYLSSFRRHRGNTPHFTTNWKMRGYAYDSLIRAHGIVDLKDTIVWFDCQGRDSP
jgi:hypothetical protein